MTANSRTQAERPVRQLLADLPMLGGDDESGMSPQDQAVLRQRIAANAATVMAVCQNGLGSLGHLLAHSSLLIEDGTVGADSVEALGWLMAEIGDLAAACAVLSSECRGAPAPEQWLKS